MEYTVYPTLIFTASCTVNSEVPFISKTKEHILKIPLGKEHPLVMINTIRQVVLKTSGKIDIVRNFEDRFPLYYRD